MSHPACRSRTLHREGVVSGAGRDVLTRSAIADRAIADCSFPILRSASLNVSSRLQKQNASPRRGCIWRWSRGTDAIGDRRSRDRRLQLPHPPVRFSQCLIPLAEAERFTEKGLYLALVARY